MENAHHGTDRIYFVEMWQTVLISTETTTIQLPSTHRTNEVY